MKITAFNPIIATKDPENVIKVFKTLGFEIVHQKENVDNKGITDVRMKDENGFHVDVTSAGKEIQNPKDEMAIRINVDDFDNAYTSLMNLGFVNILGDHIIETETSKEAIMFAPSGFGIRLTYHIKK